MSTTALSRAETTISLGAAELQAKLSMEGDVVQVLSRLACLRHRIRRASSELNSLKHLHDEIRDVMPDLSRAPSIVAFATPESVEQAQLARFSITGPSSNEESALFPASTGVTVDMPPPKAPSPSVPTIEKENAHIVSTVAFNELHPSVRGRAKLADVNNVLELLFAHFRDRRDHTITVKALDHLGGLVTGSTGKSVLQILQRSGFIQLRRDVITWKGR